MVYGRRSRKRREGARQQDVVESRFGRLVILLLRREGRIQLWIPIPTPPRFFGKQQISRLLNLDVQRSSRAPADCEKNGALKMLLKLPRSFASSALKHRTSNDRLRLIVEKGMASCLSITTQPFRERNPQLTILFVLWLPMVALKMPLKLESSGYSDDRIIIIFPNFPIKGGQRWAVFFSMSVSQHTERRECQTTILRAVCLAASQFSSYPFLTWYNTNRRQPNHIWSNSRFLIFFG